MARGVLYITSGDTDDLLKRSIHSLNHCHPELTYKVIQLDALHKSQMFDLSPFDETLYLDASTVVLGRLDYGFLRAERFGLAVCMSVNPWSRRYYNIFQDHEDAVEYSSGVVFFDKFHSVTEKVFKTWAGSEENSRMRYRTNDGIAEQDLNDQALFTRAFQITHVNPFILPLNWNLIPCWQRSFFGPVKIWNGRENVPQSLMKWNQQQSQTDLIDFTSLPLV